MVKPEKFGHLHLVYHFTVPLNTNLLLTILPGILSGLVEFSTFRLLII